MKAASCGYSHMRSMGKRQCLTARSCRPSPTTEYAR
jgi:hypothetical protein